MTTIAGIATDDPQFSILVDVLFLLDESIPGSDLVGTLSDPSQDLTVFAPTNDAFGALAADLGFAGDVTDSAAVTTFLVENVAVETLNEIVLYHVLPESLSSGDLAADADGAVPTLQGASIGTGSLPTLVDGEPDLLDPSLIATDIEADNGVVHVIDRVLLPIDLPDNDAPTIAEIVAGDGFDANAGDFDILRTAVEVAALDGVIADASLDLTVFAPTDQAFIDLATTLGFTGTGEEEAFGYIVDALTLLNGGDPIPLLTDILLYHIAGEGLQSSEVLSQGAVETLQGGTLTVDGVSLVDADPDLTDPNLVVLDIQAANGITHVIDGVLIPADLLVSDGANDVDFIIGGDFVDDHVFTGADADYVSGKGGNDLIFTGAGDDTALGGEGFDRLIMGSGDDLAQGGSEGDRILGQSGADTLDGQEGDDIVVGGRGADVLQGGTGRDHIIGGRGDDVIDGGGDQDIMSGGHGHDTFVFGENSGSDVILDFQAGDDQIDISALDIGLHQLEVKRDGADTLILLNETGDLIRLEHVAPHQLSADDFIL